MDLVAVSDVGKVDVLGNSESKTKTISFPSHRECGLSRHFESVEMLWVREREREREGRGE